jgi:hypothetical protein
VQVRRRESSWPRERPSPPKLGWRAWLLGAPFPDSRLRCHSLVSRRSASLGHELRTEISFRGQRVMGDAAQSEIRGQVGAISRERPQMMQLEVVRFPAALTARVDIGAVRTISPMNLAPDGCWDVSTALARLVMGRLVDRRGDALARLVMGRLVDRRGDALARCFGGRTFRAVRAPIAPASANQGPATTQPRGGSFAMCMTASDLRQEQSPEN